MPQDSNEPPDLRRKSNNPKGREPDDLTGRKFGRLTVVRYNGASKWICKCDCTAGTTTVVSTCNLNGGHTLSCGCWRHEQAIKSCTKHGHTVGKHPTKIWYTWSSMLRRCEEPGRNDYYLYGGRGITVCSEWHEFKVFLSEMGEKPEGLSLGRIDNNKGYSKSNCRWETPEMQGSNKRNNHNITIGSETKTVSQWARLMDIDPDVVFCRIRRGWNEIEAVTTSLTR